MGVRGGMIIYGVDKKNKTITKIAEPYLHGGSIYGPFNTEEQFEKPLTIDFTFGIGDGDYDWENANRGLGNFVRRALEKGSTWYALEYWDETVDWREDPTILKLIEGTEINKDTDVSKYNYNNPLSAETIERLYQNVIDYIFQDDDVLSAIEKIFEGCD